MDNTNKELYDKIKEILFKKAEGYFYNEEIYEYQSTEDSTACDTSNNSPKNVSQQLDFFETDLKLNCKPKKSTKTKMQLTKKKVTSHHVPPDLSAIKMLIDIFGQSENTNEDLSNLTESELMTLKNQLIQKLKDYE